MQTEPKSFWKEVLIYGLGAAGIVLLAIGIVVLLGWGDSLLPYLYEAFG